MTTPSQTSPDVGSKWVPWGLALLALGLRFRLWGFQGWYPDEGAFTEMALNLWRTGMPSIGGIKQTALLPMGCSWLAPAFAAPWAGLASSAIIGVRAWTAVLAALSVLGLFLLGRRWATPVLGVAAALSLAVWPLPVHLGAWGTYHHLAAALLLLGAWLAADLTSNPQRLRWLQFCFVVGLTVTAAYWTFWLALLPLSLAWQRERRSWLPLGLLLMALPILIALGLGYAADPPSFSVDLRTLSHLTRADLPEELRRVAILYSIWMVSKAFPPLALGLLGLMALAVRDIRAKALSPLGAAALALSLGGADVFRQRQNLEGFPYPLVLALPAVCLGLGLVVDWSVKAWKAKQPRWVLGALVSVGVLIPQPTFTTMEQLSAPTEETADLLSKAASELRPGDLVIGQAPINWGFPKGVRVCQFDDLAVAAGEGVAMLPGDLPPSRFLGTPTLGEARWIVVSPYTHGFTFTQPACLLLGLRAEQLGFYKTWSNRVYTVYENPRHTGKRPAYAERLLGYYNLYDTAAMRALDRKDLALARFALQQGSPYQEGDVEGRKRTLDIVERQLGIKH